MSQEVSVFWFRRDLRIEDNAGLHASLSGAHRVQPIFIFDTEILDGLPRKDARVEFIHQSLKDIQGQLKEKGASLDVRMGKPLDVWEEILADYKVATVFTNHDYEPYARKRDEEVRSLLQSHGVEFQTYKDHVILEKDEVLKPDGTPYTVYTPYSKAWKATCTEEDLRSYPSEDLDNWHTGGSGKWLTLEELGFEPSGIAFPEKEFNLGIIENYHNTRDIPGISGTTRLSVHLRFGTISIRALMRLAKESNVKYWNELIWREFYISVLWHFPQVVNENFNRKYDRVLWRNDRDDFQKWCDGLTGYPIVDAGMRELNQTGYMHNRTRMIVASFLTKHLLIDWRWGEAYFAEKLLDFELANNNGGWQWAAGTGVDAAPYFRVFNPYIQTEKFDPDRAYIKKWVPEFDSPDYPEPMVDHAFARERALEAYKEALTD